jgi:hypothetical protein
MGQNIAQFASLMDGAGSLWGAVTPDPTWERELLEELAKTILVFTLIGIDFGIASLEIHRRENAGGAMSGASEEDHVQVVLLDQAVEVDICE